MKYDFLVLGADGVQGQIATKYFLLKNYKILCSDIYSANVRAIIKKYQSKKGRGSFVYCDLRDEKSIVRLIKKSHAPIVVNCADMYLNLNVYGASLAAKVHCVDLGSWIELTLQQLRMDKKFKKIRRTAITGCGSVPGIGNIMLSYASKKFDSLQSVDVGFAWTSNMKVFVQPFSIKSILEELTYNPKIMNGGEYIQKKPLEISIRRNFRLIGPQRVYMVQHPEVYTFWRYFKKQGLKRVRFFAGFPEHSFEKIKNLIEFGFHSDKPIKVEGKGGSVRVAPFDILNPVFKRLKTPKGYTESENLWVKITGKTQGKKKTVLMECLVPPIKGWEDSGCNIDTGFPACIIAEMIADGRISKHGSFAPEAVVPEIEFFKELTYNGCNFLENGKKLTF